MYADQCEYAGAPTQKVTASFSQYFTVS